MRRGRHVALVAALVAGAVPAGGSSQSEAAGDRALETVRQIARERPAGSAGERAVANLVAAKLDALGYRVTRQPFPLPRGGTSLNVVGRTPGRVAIVIGAHMDGVRGSPAANDNASGVAVMLELARALAGRPGVLVAAIGAEERHETGSRVHLGAQRLARGLSPAGKRLVVVLDMVGVGSRLHVRGIEARPNASARLLLRGGGTYLRDPGQSDHAELTRAGIPAAWVQWREDACWHRSCDRASRVAPGRLEAAYTLVLRAAIAATALTRDTLSSQTLDHPQRGLTPSAAIAASWRDRSCAARALTTHAARVLRAPPRDTVSSRTLDHPQRGLTPSAAIGASGRARGRAVR